MSTLLQRTIDHCRKLKKPLFSRLKIVDSDISVNSKSLPDDYMLAMTRKKVTQKYLLEDVGISLSVVSQENIFNAACHHQLENNIILIAAHTNVKKILKEEDWNPDKVAELYIKKLS